MLIFEIALPLHSVRVIFVCPAEHGIEGLEDDDKILEIYENMNDKLKVTTKLLEMKKDKACVCTTSTRIRPPNACCSESTTSQIRCCVQIRSLEQETVDLKSEFETERADYLDTIRRQEQQMALLNAIIEKVRDPRE